MQFSFATAGQIEFGPGKTGVLEAMLPSYGSRAFLVTGSSPSRAEPLRKMIESRGVTVHVYAVSGEPDLDTVQQGAALARDVPCDFVIGMGGGSVLDTGKAISALMTNHDPLIDYLEVIGSAKSLKNPTAPYVAIPTTAGTGTEVTRNAVITSPEHHVKVSMRHRWMIPDVAIIDPELTVSMPPAVTASTGLDALTQVLEPFVSGKSNPFADGFCRQGIRAAASSLRDAYLDGSNMDAREGMALAGLMGGLALANAGLGAVHGFAGPMGGMFSLPHGVLCACLLPHVMRVNVRALMERMPASPAVKKYDELGQLLTGRKAAAMDGVEWIQQLCSDLKIRNLSEMGVTRKDFDAIVIKAARSSSMKGNPVDLKRDEMMMILEAAF